MFAAPGWKISAHSVATQASNRLPPEFNDPVPHARTSNSKKRKRDQPEQRISAEDLDRLWNKHFGGSPGKSKIAGKDQSKDGKNEEVLNGEKSNHISLTDENSTDAKRLSMDPTAEYQGSRVGKKKRTKHKPYNEDSRLQDNSGIELSKKGPTKSFDDSMENFTETAKNGNVARPVMKVAKTSPRALAMPPPSPPPPIVATNLTPLQAKMRKKLTSARFRHLNQTLYTSSSSDALQLFSDSPELFGEYHAGFSQQVKDSWPRNPVDMYIREIKERGMAIEYPRIGQSTAKLPLPRRKTGRCTIADLGCGDAPLARGCQSQVKLLQLKFHNYDLHAPNSFITKADMANLPLRDGEADIAVFCLSLMGTNWIDFVEETWRILRGDSKGEVWVAEVKSRFGRVKPKVVENSVGKKKKKVKVPKNDSAGAEDETTPINGEELFVEDDQTLDQEADATDISAFLNVFLRRGFLLREGSVDRSNKMFISAIFTKAGVPTTGKYKGWKWTGRQYEKNAARNSGRMKFLDSQDAEVSPEEEARVLKPCVYKSR